MSLLDDGVLRLTLIGEVARVELDSGVAYGESYPLAGESYPSAGGRIFKRERGISTEYSKMEEW